MRIDKFLNTVNITKRRALAQDMCVNGVVFINDIVVKASRSVSVNDIIEVRYFEKILRYKVLLLPTMKTIPKNKQDLYVEEIR